RAAEVGPAHGLEVAGQLDRESSRLDDRERPPGDVGDVRVGRVVPHAVARTLDLRPADELTYPIRAHPAPAVPLVAAVAQPNAVQHAGTGEPVIAAGVLVRERVRTDAQEASGQLARDRAADAEIVSRDLFANGGEVSRQVAIGRVRHRDFLLRVRVRAVFGAARTPSS